jgi:hypothetical protein
MDLLPVVVALALGVPPPREIDFDAPVMEARTEINSPYLQDMMLAAMAMPYAYRVTQMPCKAAMLQPARGWSPAREPSGKISWVKGATTEAKWSGIYGTCLIHSPRSKEDLGEAERAALECECNGWLPKGIANYPQP